MKSIKKILIVSFICTLTIIGTAGLTFSQIPLQEAVLPANTDNVQPQPDVPPADTGEVQSEPEAPKQISDVKVENDLLSVELMDADFGTVINSIAEKAGFKVEMTGDVPSRKITTKFNNIDIERGVLRLLTLIKEKNYMSHYDTKGMLSKLEIYGSGATTMTRPSMPLPVRPQIQRPTPPAAPRVTPPRPPVPYVRPIPARPRFPQRAPQIQRPAVKAPEAPSQPDVEEEDEEDEDEEDEDVESDVPSTDIPYIAPQKKPVSIPPVKR